MTHSIAGCTGVSALFKRGKTFAFKAVDNDHDMSCLNAFKSSHATQEEIQSAGEKFLLNIYSAPSNIESLDDLRFVKYKDQIKGLSLTAASGFDLRTLPPTSDTAKYHSYRAYYEVQKKS